MQTQYSLAPVANVLLSELGKDFAGFVRSCIGEDVAAAIATLPAGRVILLENTRFHAGEMANDSRFAEQLASPFKILVNDAFAVLHRRQASVTGIAEHVPVVLPGLLVRKEIEALSRILFSPTRPLVVVLGGAKVEDKIDIIDSLSCRASKILVGGRMAFPFLYANGVLVGATQIGGKLQTQLAKDIELRARQRGVDFILPDDQIVASKLQPQATTSIVPLTLTCCTNELEPCIPEGLQGGDIGPATAKRFSNALEGAGTIFWNGPMGVYELPEFFSGTKSVAHAMAIATQHGSVTVVGGGDSAAAIRKAGLVADNFTHICTGGGASLEVLQGKILPGLQIFKS
ncbi:hypothetical protein WJX73_009025 [Symbiochloris irregularis]|uniref:Phosphoglycerate kinase n=1 Tax=Symbiochloris irregularis TaxID=706552 RepID=A0AAW1NW85_9CHLO